MGCGGSKPDKVQEVDGFRRPCVKAFPRDTRNKLPNDVFQEFEKIIKGSYQQQPDALKKEKARIAAHNNQVVMHTAKPAEEQVSKTSGKEPAVAKAPDTDVQAGNVTEPKGAGHGTTSHSMPAEPVNLKAVLDEHKSNEASASQTGKEHEEVSKIALSDNIIEFNEIEEAESARSHIAGEESRSDVESDADLEELDVTRRRLEKERLAQEEAMRRAAELKKKQDEELEAKKKKLTQIQGDANDILSKYK